MPPKKKIGKTENIFVEERMYFLDRFIKEICSLPYLYESHEFDVFLRPPADLEKCMKSLSNLSTDDLLYRFRKMIPLNEGAGDLKLKSYNEIINDFVKDCKDLIIHLRHFKRHVKTIVPIKEQEL
jgi:sorting nexin-1/2